MRKIILIIASLILATPFAANAEIVRLTYTGTVDYLAGDGFGYSYFDEITGWFEYDVDEYIALCPPGSGFCQIPVESSTGDGGFAWSLGFVLDERNATTDRFYIEDGSFENNRSPIFDTQGLEIGYVLTFGEFYHAFSDYLMSPRGGLTIYSGTETCFYADNSCIFDVVENIVGFTVSSYTIQPLAEALLDQLENSVTDEGPGSSFADKIMLAQTYLEVPDEESACLILGDFLNQVRAQRGKKLTEEQADQFTADAVAIMDAVGCD